MNSIMTTGTDSSPRRYPTETPAGQNLPLFRQQFSRTFFSVILFVLCFKHKMWLILGKKSELQSYSDCAIFIFANRQHK